jgi:hypothetical protein
MIIKASFRQPGGLAAHLVRTDNNERVVIAAARDLPRDVNEALGLLAIMGAGGQADRCLVHVVASPSPDEPDPGAKQLSRFWELYEAEFKLDGHPFIEVQHQKGARPMHVHRVYARRDPTTGHSAHDGHLMRRNEKVARIFEIECGHKPTIGKHQRAVRNALDRERPDIAEAVDPSAQPTNAQPTLDRDETQQAEACGIDPRGFRRRVHAIYREANGNWRAFAAGLDRAGISVARADRALMVLDGATGYAITLARTLRTEAKAAGAPIKITTAELERVFGKAKPLAEERTLAATRAVQSSEFTKAFFDTFNLLSDQELNEAADRRRHAAARHQKTRAAIEAKRRAEIEAYWRQYHVARGVKRFVGDNTRLLFCISLLTCGGLMPAIMLTYGALVLPSSLATEARERAETLRRENSAAKQFSFSEIDPKDRIVFGAYAHALSSSIDRDNAMAFRTHCEKLIPEATAKRFAKFFETCTPKQYPAITSWFDAENPRHVKALMSRSMTYRAEEKADRSIRTSRASRRNEVREL